MLKTMKYVAHDILLKVIHELKHLRLDQGLVDWRILSLEDTSKAKSKVLDKEQSHPFDSDREYDDFVCMHCRARVSRRDLNHHLRSRYAVSSCPSPSKY
jgi:hypothetical protein